MRQCMMAGWLLIMTWALGGCQGALPTQTAPEETATPESILESIKAQLLEEKPSVAAYRNTVQQLNQLVDMQADFREKWKLTATERGLVLGTLLTGVPNRQQRFDELDSSSFTIADAHYLDSCFLFRDAAHTLLEDMGPKPGRGADSDWLLYNLEVLDHAWSWTDRHLQPQARPAGSIPWPTHDILRRGYADPEERLRVFCALMEQFNLFVTEERQLRLLEQRLAQTQDAEERAKLEQDRKSLADLIARNKIEVCVITRLTPVRASDGTEQMRQRPWLIGAQIGTDLFLYDPARGGAVPGATPDRPLTWRELKAQPELLQKLFPAGPDAPLPAQIEKSEAWLAVDYPALAPRMRWFEEVLDDNPVVLHVNLPARLERIATANPGLTARPWNDEARPGYPAFILQDYLPVRDQVLRETLVPRYLMAHWVHEMASEIGIPQYYQPLYDPFDGLFLRTQVEPGGIRDLLVRGRAGEAIQRIVFNEDQLDRMMDNFHLGGFNEVRYLVLTWKPRVVETVNLLKDLRAQLRLAPAAEQPALEQQLQKVAQNLEQLYRDRRMIYGNIIVEWALPEYREHLVYYMALAKLDLAERLEIQARQLKLRPSVPGQDVSQELARLQARERELRESALFWFDRLEAIVHTQVRSNWLNGVRRLRPLCQAKLDQLPKPTTAQAAP
ncbi:MAG TPA: hypothetical protein PKC45_14680 [Gemmatales bacterium]|nr:hypothetical protein [Gemmatales bacterium]